MSQGIRQNLGLGDIATHSASEFLPSSYAPPAAPVTSVNGKTGDVQLAASDVHALPDTYVPPAPDLSGYETIVDANARFVQGVSFGAMIQVSVSGNQYVASAGCVLCAIQDNDTGNYPSFDSVDDVYQKPLQVNINGTWATVAG
ncbi:hypothetical protein S922_20485 [Salmonella enterica subsp. enterica]|nr:hypothetical protein [Salmonella enterica subsp. enterica]EAW9773823.1 hypothetical protein [Salmonella enterica]